MRGRRESETSNDFISSLLLVTERPADETPASQQDSPTGRRSELSVLPKMGSQGTGRGSSPDRHAEQRGRSTAELVPDWGAERPIQPPGSPTPGSRSNVRRQRLRAQALRHGGDTFGGAGTETGCKPWWRLGSGSQELLGQLAPQARAPPLRGKTARSQDARLWGRGSEGAGVCSARRPHWQASPAPQGRPLRVVPG